MKLNMWIKRTALAQARRRQFFLAAATLHWIRLGGVLTAVAALLSVTGTSTLNLLNRAGYVVLALLYAGSDIYFGAKDLQRRVRRQELIRQQRERRPGK